MPPPLFTPFPTAIAPHLSFLPYPTANAPHLFLPPNRGSYPNVKIKYTTPTFALCSALGWLGLHLTFSICIE